MKHHPQAQGSPPSQTGESCLWSSNDKLKPWLRWGLPGTAFLLLLAFLTFHSQSRAADPGLSITLLTNDQVQVDITNAVSTNIYVLYRRARFDSEHPWMPIIVGTNGQSSFITTNVGPEWTVFFRVITGTNWDGDAIENWQDANPLDSNVLSLTITIQSPTNGSTIY